MSSSSSASLTFFLILVTSLGGRILAFDLTLDTDQHRLRWSFNGSYLYGASENQVIGSRPTSAPPLLRSSGQQQAEGVWLIKYEPNGSNKFRLSYTLTHILFKEAWIVWMASPSIPLVIKTSGDKEIGRFWSDGRSWCDIVVDVNYHSTITLEVETPEPDDYAMIDRITLGVMRNVTALEVNNKRSSLRLCPTSSPSTDSPPDMEDKPTNEIRRRPPYSPSPSPTPTGIVETEERRYEQRRDDGAVCDCTCSCRKRNSSTFFTSTSPKTPTTPF